MNKNSINLNCAVFNKNDKISFTINDGYTEMLSGITETYCSKHIDRIKQNKNIYLNTVGSLNSHEKASPIIW